MPFGKAVEHVKSILKETGFGVVSEIDMQGKLREKLGHQMGGYAILGACSPAHAREAIQHEPNIGVLLPCNVVVAEESNVSCRVAMVNPMIAMQGVGNANLNKMAGEVSALLDQVLERL